MSRPRDKRPAQTPPSGAVTVPPELRIGALTEVWSATGHRYDLGSAFGNYLRARARWAADQEVDEMTLGLPSGSPWSIQVPDYQLDSGRPYGDPAERLARLGFTPDDLPALRRAAQARVTDNTRRTT